MSNINRLDNSFDDDDDNNMDTTTNQIYSPGCISISSQQPTRNYILYDFVKIFLNSFLFK
jgi:hypothetical protein